MFSDASEDAISAVGYILMKDCDQEEFGFVIGKAKVAPSHGHTIPRLELCAAVLSVELAQCVSDQLDMDMSKFRFYTDSKSILGYVNNQNRRFYTYVSNRVARIRQIPTPRQWRYVPTDKNPADVATRSISVSEFKNSLWLTGSPSVCLKNQDLESSFDLQEPELDKEIRPVVACVKTNVENNALGSHRFERFSTWNSLIDAIARLKHVAQTFATNGKCTGWHTCNETNSVSAFQKAEIEVIGVVQGEFYQKELQCLNENRALSRDSTLLKLDPFIGVNGLLRVGGRLNKGNLSYNEKNPIIVPGRHHIAQLLIKTYHEKCKHQGRHLTAGAVRSAGLWIVGGKRLVSSIIYHCVTCRRLRRGVESQKMSDLPADRLEPGPPFSCVI